WANRRSRLVNVQQRQITSNANFNLTNYQNVLTGQIYVYKAPDGTTTNEKGDDLTGAFVSTLTVTIPSTVIPILIAAFAAYAFACLHTPGLASLGARAGVVCHLSVPVGLERLPGGAHIPRRGAWKASDDHAPRQHRRHAWAGLASVDRRCVHLNAIAFDRFLL